MRPIANRASAVRGASGPSSRKAVAKTCNVSRREGNSEGDPSDSSSRREVRTVLQHPLCIGAG